MEYKRILVIEDETSLMWLVHKLVPDGREIIVMRNNLEAWSWLSEGNLCDLIVSDVKSRSQDGIELMENIRNSAILKNIPVIIFSGIDTCISA